MEHPQYNQKEIMIMLEHELQSMGAQKALLKPESIAVGNIHELDPEKVSVWIKIGQPPKKEGEQRSVQSTVLWIGQNGNLHIETNKLRKYVKGIFSKQNLIEALTNFKPICQICNKHTWITGLKKCKECGKWVCRDCRRFYFYRKVKEVKIKGKQYKITDLVYCKNCGEQYECEECECFQTEDAWGKHLEDLQIQRGLYRAPYKLNQYDNCIYCGKFVCDLHSVRIDGLFTKYGKITVCVTCLESTKCIKCKNLIIYREYNSALFNKKHDLICYQCNKKVRRKRSDVLRHNYDKHSEFQSRLKEFLEKGLHLSVQLERSLEEIYSIDFVIVNPKTKLTYGMELKTGKVSKQIMQQLEHYAKFFDYFYILVKENEVDRLINLIDNHYGVILVSDDELSITFFRQAQLNTFSKEKLLKLIKLFALRWITIFHEIGIKPTLLRKMKKQELVQVIANVLDIEAVRDIYCQYILKEDYVFGFSITNQQYYEMYPQFKPKAIGNLTLDKFIEG